MADFGMDFLSVTEKLRLIIIKVYGTMQNEQSHIDGLKEIVLVCPK